MWTYPVLLQIAQSVHPIYPVTHRGVPTTVSKSILLTFRHKGPITADQVPPINVHFLQAMFWSSICMLSLSLTLFRGHEETTQGNLQNYYPVVGCRTSKETLAV